jgi:WD40-like Beta Propeller Repeat
MSGAWMLRFLWCLIFGACCFSSRAAFVYETPGEFLTSGDFDGDGRADALVLDKLTGNVRVGYQNTNGALVWSVARATGADPVSALAVGRFADTNRDAIAVTAMDLNQIRILKLSSPSNSPAPAILNPAHPGTTLLVGLETPYGTTTTRSWLTTGARDPGITLLDLFAFLGDSLAGFQDQIAAEGYLASGNALLAGTNNVSLVSSLVRGSNDTFAAYSYANQANVLYRVNLESGTEYTSGHFKWSQDTNPIPVVMFYVPGKSNLIVQRITNTVNGLAFGAPAISTFNSAIQRVYFVDEGTNGYGVVQFGNGAAGIRPSNTNDQLQVSAGLGLGAAGNVISGVVPLGIGKFALLSSASNLLASTYAQVFTKSGGNYVQTSSNSLPAETTAATRGNVWLFQSEPFLTTAATMVGSLSAPAWSSTISGLPTTLAVRVESDGGITAGLNNPSTNNFGPPPAGTVYVLPNQYRDDVSFFGYSPARAPEPSVVTISPPPGSYGGPIQISISGQNASDSVQYRTTADGAWQLYAASFPLTNDATIQYHVETAGGARGRTQYATYALGNIDVPAEPLVTLPGSDTNTLPLINPTVPQISVHGTVFYSRHTPLAELQGFQGPTPYLSFADSPFNAAGFKYFYLETFEDGAFNVPGATPSAGWVIGNPGAFTDSVDGDDGSINGSGAGGHSYYSGGTQTNLTIYFNAAALGGHLPTHAGIVWTDVGIVTSGTTGYGNVIFTARDANGVSLGTQVANNLGDGVGSAATAEDRFFGVVNAGGISSISISMANSKDWEVDHLQYGYLDSAGFNDSIWAINLDGNGETFITEGARPRVSPDGKWMAFLREGGVVTTQGNLWLRELATGVESRFYTNTDAILGFDWNGTNELVFDNNCVFLRRTLGGTTTQLPLALTPQCLNTAPVINRVDNRLAFQNLNPNAPGVYLAPPSWASRTKVTEPFTLRLRWPAWSSDGTRLAMADRTSSQFVNTGVNLWTAAADGSNLQQITALSEPAGGFPHGAIWSPDGNALVGAGRIGGTNGLWVINLASDGSACHCPPRLLPTSAGSEIDFAGSILSAAPKPGASYASSGLFIRLDPALLVVYWSTNYDGYALESATGLSGTLLWSPVSGPYFRAGPDFEYRESRTALAGQKYFRLHYPGILVLTPPEPDMALRLEPQAAVLNWPLNYVGYTVESTTNLSRPVLWVPLKGEYINTNGAFEYRRTLPGPPREFYHLRGP